MNSIKKIKERELKDRKKRSLAAQELYRLKAKEKKRLEKAKELIENGYADKAKLLLESPELYENIKKEETYAKNKPYMKKYRENNKPLIKELAWKSKGIILTFNEYQEMFKRQCGKCKICNSNINLLKDKDDKANKYTAHVDHNHITGTVRGLLCNDCNNGLGRFKDNIQSLKNAVYYLSSQNPLSPYK